MKRAIFLAILLGGCGPGYYVEFQSQTSVTYWYDPARQSMGSVQRIAQGYCGQYSKDALPQAWNGDRYAGISISFVCREPG